MKKILAFSGSNSSTSINQQLVSAVASTIKDHSVKIIQLTDYPLPLYDIDLEKTEEFPENLAALLEEIKWADALIISVNEHNGTVSAFFKNTLDWLTRIEYKFPKDKNVLLMSTSPGKRGGLSALEYISGFLPRIEAQVVASIPFPFFDENFDTEAKEIKNSELASSIKTAIDALVS